MNPVGVSCTSFARYPFGEILKDVSECFSHWEIFSELRHYAPDVLRDRSESMKDSGLTFSLHTGIADINVASSNEIIRSASIDNLKEEMKAAYGLGIDTVTVHPGIVNLAVKDTRGISLAQANRSMKDIEKTADEYGLCACIENMPDFPVMLGITAEELGTIIDGTDLPVCFDIGHANTAGQIDSMVEKFGDRIRNVHIHDNMGANDDHMTVGDGKIDFPHVLGLLGYYRRGYIIESRSLESAVVSKTRLERMLGQ